MRFSVVCTLIDYDTPHHSGQTVVDSRGVVMTAIVVDRSYSMKIEIYRRKIKDGLACKQALRIGYSEICFRTARGWAREGEPAMVLVRFEFCLLSA